MRLPVASVKTETWLGSLSDTISAHARYLRLGESARAVTRCTLSKWSGRRKLEARVSAFVIEMCLPAGNAICASSRQTTLLCPTGDKPNTWLSARANTSMDRHDKGEGVMSKRKAPA